VRFRVYRTGDWGDKKSPCLKAEFEDGNWFIEIESISALLDFARVHKHEIIINAENDPPTIEIYDDYRE
jgi:hypothetical protein